MPLFGSKNNHTNNNDNLGTAAGNNNLGGGRHHMSNNAEPGFTGTHGLSGAGTGPGGAGGYQSNLAGHGTGLGNNNGPTNTFAPDPYAGNTTGNHFSDNTYNTTGSTGHGGIPPTGQVNHGTTSGGGGAGQRLTGKAERTIGNLVGSTALQAKGAEKEREAGAVKLQGRELAEAERLEQEALMRRERAVGHGAHPANSALGAGNTVNGSGPTGFHPPL